MARKGKISFERLPEDDLILLAKYGDREAMGVLWEACIPQVRRIVAKFANRYEWVDRDDLEQEVLCKVPHIVSKFDETRKTGVNKYFYFCFYRAAQDALRRLDPLGMKFPQRKVHPPFLMLSEISGADGSQGSDLEASINTAHENLLRGYEPNLDFWDK